VELEIISLLFEHFQKKEKEKSLHSLFYETGIILISQYLRITSQE
jgi:hypothetical protein